VSTVRTGLGRSVRFALSPPHDCCWRIESRCSLVYTIARLSTRASACLHVRGRLHACVLARVRACASAWMRGGPSACALALAHLRARSACVRVYECSFACVHLRVFICVCVPLRAYARLCSATQACTTLGYSWAAPLVLAGYQGYSESTRGALDRAL
jgi:hypothetical protein